LKVRPGRYRPGARRSSPRRGSIRIVRRLSSGHRDLVRIVGGHGGPSRCHPPQTGPRRPGRGVDASWCDRAPTRRSWPQRALAIPCTAAPLRDAGVTAVPTQAQPGQTRSGQCPGSVRSVAHADLAHHRYPGSRGPSRQQQPAHQPRRPLGCSAAPRRRSGANWREARRPGTTQRRPNDRSGHQRRARERPATFFLACERLAGGR